MSVVIRGIANAALLGALNITIITHPWLFLIALVSLVAIEESILWEVRK